LRFERQLADLVEKERSAVGALKPTLPRLIGASEAPFLVTEELRVDQFGRDGAAVDANEGPRGPRAAMMQRSRDQFFARSGFSQNQHGHIRLRHKRNPVHHLTQTRVLADDRVAQIGATEPAEQGAFFGFRSRAQTGDLVEPMVILERDGEGLAQSIGEFAMGVAEWLRRPRGQKQYALSASFDATPARESRIRPSAHH
jgi:hypothetical protein